MLQKENRSRVLELFFLYPTKKWYLRELSRAAEIAHTSVKAYFKEFLKEKLILEKKELYFTYAANNESEYYKLMKKMFWINAIHSSGLLDYIADKMQPVCIIFFGSSEKGEDIESSDIDLFVEAKEQEIDVQKFSRLLTREISIHFKEHFNDLSKELKNNILNGTKLYGYLKIF